MIKKFLAVIILCTLTGIATVHAQTGYKFIVDGKEHEISESDVIKEDGQMYIAARRFAEIMGFELEWDGEKKEIIFEEHEKGKIIFPPVNNRDGTISVTYTAGINSNTISKRVAKYMNVKEKNFKTKTAVIKDSRSYISLLNFVEILCYSTDIEQATRKIVLSYKGSTWQQEYYDILLGEYESVTRGNESRRYEISEDGPYVDTGLYFVLYDINNDGIPELFETGASVDYADKLIRGNRLRGKNITAFTPAGGYAYTFNQEIGRAQLAGQFIGDIFRCDPDGIYIAFGDRGEHLMVFNMVEGKLTNSGTGYRNLFTPHEQISLLPLLDRDVFFSTFDEDILIEPVKATPENIEAILGM